MTIKELRKVLAEFPEDALVVSECESDSYVGHPIRSAGNTDFPGIIILRHANTYESLVNLYEDGE